MTVRYKFQATDAFYLTAYKRHWKQRRTDRFITAFIIFGGSVLLLCASMMAWLGEWLPALTALCFALIILLCRRFDRFMTLRQIKQSPYRNEHLETSLSESGLIANGGIGSATASWQAFTKAVRYPDGVLLYQGPNIFNWLPDSALVEGSTPEQVVAIVQTHIPNCRTIV